MSTPHGGTRNTTRDLLFAVQVRVGSFKILGWDSVRGAFEIVDQWSESETLSTALGANANVRTVSSLAAHHYQAPSTHDRNLLGRVVAIAPLPHPLVLGSVVVQGRLPHAEMDGPVVAHGPLAQARMVDPVLAQKSLVHALLLGSVVVHAPLAHVLLLGSVVALAPLALLGVADPVAAQHLPTHSRACSATSHPTAPPGFPPEPSSRTRLSRPRVLDASLVPVQEP